MSGQAEKNVKRAMKKIKKRIQQVASTDTTVLLKGETGTGAGKKRGYPLLAAYFLEVFGRKLGKKVDKGKLK